MRTESPPQREIPSQTACLTRRSLFGAAIAAAIPMVALQSDALAIERNANNSEIGLTSPLLRYQHAAASLPNGWLLLTGGHRHDPSKPTTSVNLPMSSSQLYDPFGDIWYNAAPMNLGRARHAAIALGDGRVLVAGGYRQSPLASAEIYDPTSNTWTIVNPLRIARCDHTLCLANGQVVVIGGIHSGPLSSREIYTV